MSPCCFLVKEKCHRIIIRLLSLSLLLLVSSSLGSSTPATATLIPGSFVAEYTLVGDVLSVTLTQPAGTYGAIGIAPTGMTGSIIACSHNGGTPWCKTYAGYDLGINVAGSNLATLVSSAENATLAVIKFSISASSFGVTGGTAQRIIFATGSVSGGTPQQHSLGNRFKLMLDLNSAAGYVPPPAQATGPTLLEISPGAVYIEYEITQSLQMTVTMTYPAGRWCGMGVGPSEMTGSIVVCYDSGSSGWCSAYTGSGNDLWQNSRHVTLVSRSQNATFSVTKFTTATSTFNILMGSSQRTFFAMGRYRGGELGGHGNNKWEALVNFQAIVPTTQYVSTASPTLAVATASPGGGAAAISLSATFSVQYQPLSAQVLSIRLTYPSGGYGAVGPAASGMVGTIVACYHNGGSPWCSTFDGFNQGLNPAASNVVLAVTSSFDNGAASVTEFTVDASRFGVTSGTAQRVIFATGGVSGSSPLAHTMSNRFAVLVDFGSASPATPAPVPVVPQASIPIAFSLSTCDGLMFEWAPPNLANGTVNGSLTFGIGQYGSIGASSSGMVGQLIVCAADFIPPGCYQYNSYNYGVSPSSANAVVTLSIAVDQARQLVTAIYKVPTGFFGSVASTQRYIFASGSFNGGPQQHSSSSRSFLKMNMMTGAVQGASLLYLWCWGVLGGSVLLWIAIGALLKQRYTILSRDWRVMPFVLALTLSLILACVFAAYFQQYTDDGKLQPIFRAFGMVACACFVLILLPTCKHVGLARIVGSSYERAIWIHPVLGTTLLLSTTVHFAGMGTEIGAQEVSKWASTVAKNSPLAGLLSWIFLVAMSLPALLLRRKAFAFFKYTHWLFMAVFVFAILHYKPLILMALPGLVLWATDFCLRFYSNWRAHPQIRRAEYDERVKLVRLEVGVSWAADPVAAEHGEGQYVLIQVPSLGPSFHPFTVALCDQTRSSITLFIKPAGSWTTALSEVVTTKQGLTSLQIQGPYGNLQTPLERHHCIVLVCAGIGLTPMSRILQVLAESSPDRFPKLTHVWLAWSHRSQDMFRYFLSELKPMLLSRRGGGVSVRIFNHCTVPPASSSLVNSANQPPTRSMASRSQLHLTDQELRVVTLSQSSCSDNGEQLSSPADPQRGLPQVHHYNSRLNVKALFEQLRVETRPSPGSRSPLGGLQTVADHSSTTDVGLYLCGPSLFMKDAAVAARCFDREDMSVQIHEETFEL